MRRVNTIICQNASLRGPAICQVRGSRNELVRGKAAREPVASPLCCGRDLIVHRRRILSRRNPAYAMPCREVLPMHTPPPDSGETESLYVLVLPPSRKAPRLGQISVLRGRSTIPETKCSKDYACRFRTHAAVSPGPFRGIRS